MRISDWSSDVCSSDLEPPHIPADFNRDRAGRVELWEPLPVGKAIDAAADDEGDESEGETGPDDSSVAASDPASLLLSRAIADEVQVWIEHGKAGRSVATGDILILVRRPRDLAADSEERRVGEEGVSTSRSQ